MDQTCLYIIYLIIDTYHLFEMMLHNFESTNLCIILSVSVRKLIYFRIQTLNNIVFLLMFYGKITNGAHILMKFPFFSTTKKESFCDSKS